MLQNRVNPFGELIRTPERGAWLGNRGVLHNDKQEIVRSFKIKAWIICVLSFKGRHREIMQPNRWTELFFLDEATAFAAGHRPCFQCRYLDHQRFKQAWIAGNPEYGFDMKTPVAKIDDILHAERIGTDKAKVTYKQSLQMLPDGTIVSYQNIPYLVSGNLLHEWTPGGYKHAIPFPDISKITVLTPQSIVNMFTHGYLPQMAL